MAALILSPRGRELHLIDVENLLGTPYFTATAVSALRSTYDRVSKTGWAAQQVIGTSAASTCPVRELCLDYALEYEEFGVWGGSTPEERDELRGYPFSWTWDQRVEAQRLRSLFSRDVPEEKIAEEYAVSTRSVQRKKVEYLALSTAA